MGNIQGSPRNGCKKQYESSGLGVSAAYDFLAKDAGSGPKVVTIPEAISSSDVLRFAPVAFSRTSSVPGNLRYVSVILLSLLGGHVSRRRTTALRSVSSTCLASRACSRTRSTVGA